MRPVTVKPGCATPNLKAGAVTVIDMDEWKVIKQIKTPGPVFFLRSHEATPYAWADVFFGPCKDAMHVIDKRALEIVKTLYPGKGRTSAHVEFTRDGRCMLVCVGNRWCHLSGLVQFLGLLVSTLIALTGGILFVILETRDRGRGTCTPGRGTARIR